MDLDRAARAPKAAELVADALRRRVARGELRPGDTLPPEGGLLEQFGVSRPTLREAYRVLEAEGLISVRRGSRGGAQVLQPDVSVAARHVGLVLQLSGTTLRDLYEARSLTEPVCARLLAQRRTDEDLADLSGCVSALRAVVAAGPEAVADPGQWSGLTSRFHGLVVERCGNRTLAVQGGVLQDLAARHLAVLVDRYLADPDAPARFRAALRSYDRFVALVRAQDPAGAERHWRAHMEAAAPALLRDDLQAARIVDLYG
ncbi:MAG: regulatory protein GntR [Frankiales bacterium]|nr:regulatory protein GntR [Frankiales bacterium]